MQDNNINTYRIHTGIGSDAPNVLNVKLQQTYDMLEILSLKLSQTNAYNFYESSYGIVVGRVLANDAFGIPNAKVSIFIPVDDAENIATRGIYPFTSIRSTDSDGVRYNLLPDEEVSACHQNVGTFPNKRLVLDNNDIIEIFDKYWKYTTVTNEAGDYMLFGVPTGDQQLHVDVDLSDIGVLSQRPRDMIYKGYNEKLFESPNKFKQSKNLDSLSQIFSQNKGVYVYPYWGDTSNTEETIAITRCDIQLEYKFEPTCIFMGCIITDQGENAIGKNCAAVENNGRMKNLIAGEGSIEMIRKTIDGKVEEFPIQGNRLIDSNGVWCYQIPMNLDYVRTDEYGNIVPTDNPNKGIPTRTRVRFRISLDETPNDSEARKRCRYLVPNNPTMDASDYPIFNQTKEFDYDFGTTTRDEDYKDLFWNKVYTVKNYIPRLQKGSDENSKKHTGIKAVNFFENNNPFPYNNLLIKLSFTYKIICVLVKFILGFVMMLNMVFSIITNVLLIPYKSIEGIRNLIRALGKTIILKPITKPLEEILNLILNILDALMIDCIGFGSDFCDDGINKVKYFLGCLGNACDRTKRNHDKEQASLSASEREVGVCLGLTDMTEVNDTTLFTCVEQQLAQDNDCVNFNFHNDWVNGVLYAPLWYRRITPKKTFLFGIFRKKAKDQWCSADRGSNGAKLFQPCALARQNNGTFVNNDGEPEPIYASVNRDCNKDNDCLSSNISSVGLVNGIIKAQETMYDQTVYYYKAGEYQQNLDNHNGEILTLFATDIVLLGSLNECDINGIPQFFKNLTSTTYNMPNNILVVDTEVTWNVDDNGNLYSDSGTTTTEATGCDWGNINRNDEYREDNDGGLFYGIGCLKVETKAKTCVNLSRICEYGVILDETKFVENVTSENSETDNSNYMENLLIPDGYISYDELMNIDERSMFATLNGNHLRTKLNKKTGLYEYDLRHYYVDNFDGAIFEDMEELEGAPSNITYRNNFRMELLSKDYYHFRMGDKPFYYDNEHRLPRYDNSFYFYFGIKPGSTAIEKFNSQFFSTCENADDAKTAISVTSQSNSWCFDENNLDDYGFIKLDLTGISTPYDLTITYKGNSSYSKTITNETNEKIYFSQIDKYNDDDNSEFKDHELIQIFEKPEEEGGTTTKYEMPNGTYTITIVDGDGVENEFDVVMNDKYITFSTYSRNFALANNILLSEYGVYKDPENKNLDYKKTYCKIAQQAVVEAQFTGGDKVLSEVTSDLGGLIGIYDIYTNNKPVEGNIRITVESKKELIDSEEENRKWDITFDITNGNSSIIANSKFGNIVNLSQDIKDEKVTERYIDILSYNISNDTNNEQLLSYYVIGVPKGNEDYIITVTQLCNGEETANKTTSSVNVGEPRPYKLYINGVDYDIIKDFKSGYNINNIDGITAEPNKSETPTEWLSISDKNNYKWENNELYTLKHYTDMGVSTEEAQAEVDRLKNELINTMKSRFMLRCANEPFTLSFNVETDDTPYTLVVGYKEEEDGGMDYDHNIITNCQNIVEEVLTISDINIPTITSKDNDIYGSNNDDYQIPRHTDKCYAVSPPNGCLKSPYYVAVINSRGNTIPRSGNVKVEAEEQPNLYGYFAIHIIDKVMRLKCVAWAYMDKIPYYKPKNTALNGQSFTRKGLLAGILYNGISTSDNKFAEFNTQTLDKDNIEIQTYTYITGEIPDEDAIPTRRVITGNRSEEDEVYAHYAIPNTVKNTLTYASVNKKDLKLTISDESCQITEEIYGGMYIEPSYDETTIDARNQNQVVITISAKNQNATETRYYAISYNADVNDGNSNYLINCMGMGEQGIREYNDYSYMMYEITEDNLSVYIDESFISERPDSEGSDTMVESRGWGTTGVFTWRRYLPGQIPPQACFFIAVSDVTRCISQVYELISYTVDIEFIKKYEDNTSDIIYEFKVILYNTDNSYYLHNYNYSVNVSANASVSDNVIEMNYDFEGMKGDFELIKILEDDEETDDMFTNIHKLSLRFKQVLAQQIIVSVIDESKLRHICKVDTFSTSDKTQTP